MVRHKKIQPLAKRFGEQLTIKKPDLASKTYIVVEDDPYDGRFPLMPELPSHVPTPATIDQGIEGIQRQFETMFTADDGVTTPTRKRVSRKTSKTQSENSRQRKPLQAPGTPDHSPYSTKAVKILIASPHSSKWGPDVWNAKKRTSFFHRFHTTERPLSPSDTVSESSNSIDSSESLENSPKLIINEEVVEIVERKNFSLNQKLHSASALQLKWVQQNALNLHSSCEDMSRDDAQRSRFFRPRLRRTNVDRKNNLSKRLVGKA